MTGILVGIDGSGNSSRALKWAAREATLRKVSLGVLSVHPINAGYASYAFAYGSYLGDADQAEQARQAAQEQTDKVLAELDEASRPASVTVHAVTGLPAEALLTAADGADLIVLGSRGAGGFRKLLLGSVAQQVTQHAQVPVVVIPAEEN